MSKHILRAVIAATFLIVGGLASIGQAHAQDGPPDCDLGFVDPDTGLPVDPGGPTTGTGVTGCPSGTICFNTWSNGDLYRYACYGATCRVYDIVHYEPPITVCEYLASQNPPIDCHDVDGPVDIDGDGNVDYVGPPVEYCLETYVEPTATVSMDPPYPLTRDVTDQRITITIVITPGRYTYSPPPPPNSLGTPGPGCPPDRGDDVETITIDCITLAASSVAWLSTEVEALYPGTKELVEQMRPLCVTPTRDGDTITFTVDAPPLPGYYQHPVHVMTASGRRFNFMLRCPVTWIDTTIIK
jgi:hypothetical protein